MFKFLRAAFCLMHIMAISANGFAAHLSFESSPYRKTNLVEIFTSEGCSSCPPAHRWINEFKKDYGLWKDFIPVIFHIDYWDQTGWKDMFSSPKYTERQRAYSLLWGEPTLFTPCVVLNGKILERWDTVNSFLARAQKTGVLKLDVLGGDQYRVHFQPAQTTGQAFTAHLVLLGLGIKSRIRRGENSGQILNHEFTVLDYQRTKLSADNLTAEFKLKVSADLPVKIRPEKLALAGWISEGKDPSPVQAAGGELG